ncbi:hypothetical protein ACFFK0_03060 [Paenibacillus chartarius]|uniref:Uncharacterized protein n=1 Tax=Paenibacillus chartarius TaxID=747481 RepID=A0ABV6DFL3_9BACL
MGFVVIFVAAWLAVFIFYAMNKSLTIAENAFVYLTVMIIEINFTWIVAEELKLVELTKDGLLYAGFILNRTIVLPLLFVIMLNAVYRAGSIVRALIPVGVALAVILGLDALLQYFQITIFRQWNLFYDAIHIAILQAVSWGLLMLYRKIGRSGGKAG